MSALTYNPITYNTITFTNIGITETDSGTVAAFTASPGVLDAGPTPSGTALAWGAVDAGVYYANASEIVNFAYTVTDTSSSSLIDTIGQLYSADIASGPGVSLTAVENVYTPSGTLWARPTQDTSSSPHRSNRSMSRLP
jgi:hypothetical protein